MQTLKEVGRYELISIEEKNRNNGVVNIEIRALDTKTNETKVFPIEMTQMDNKMWRITGYDYKTYDSPSPALVLISLYIGFCFALLD